jgi:hypothetical protein
MAAAPPSSRGRTRESGSSVNATVGGAGYDCGGRATAVAVTHVLLPARGTPARADSAPVILGALLVAKAGGRGHRWIATELSLPADTVRGWLRRATANAQRTH